MNPYEILGVDRNANDKAIKKAYRALSKKWHPDFFEPNSKEYRIAEARFKEINEAHELIGTPKARAAFDASNPVSNSVYEHYAKKQTSGENATSQSDCSDDLKMEKQRQAVLAFLKEEYQQKDDILDMFAELATGALKNDFSDEEYVETLELLLEKQRSCVKTIQGIIKASEEKHITGLEFNFKQAQEVIDELTKLGKETPKTLEQAHYVEETRVLTEKIHELMSGLADRINAVTNFNLLQKTWEFADDNQLNSVRESHRKEASALLEDIKWIQETASKRNIKVGTVEFSNYSHRTIGECKDLVAKSNQNLSLGLKALRNKFWKEACEYNGQTIFSGVKWPYNYCQGAFICPPNIEGITPSALHWNRFESISIPESIISRNSKIECPNDDNVKKLIITFDNLSQVVDISGISYAVITRDGEYICIYSSMTFGMPAFAFVDSNGVYTYDAKTLSLLCGVKNLEELKDSNCSWSGYASHEIDRLKLHLWAQVAKRLPEPDVMKLLPYSVEAIKHWVSLDKTNYNIALSKCDRWSKAKLVRLYIALGALNDSYCHAQAEWLISKLDASKMYRSRQERFPDEKNTKKNAIFSVPKSAVDFVEKYISIKEFLPYVFVFLQDYERFQVEAKKAGVELSPKFVIDTAPQLIFHCKADNVGAFTKQMLEAETSMGSMLADKIFLLRSLHNKCKKNIVETTDTGNFAMHYRYLDLKSLETYIAFSQHFKLAKHKSTSFYNIEAENVFLSDNSHAIEILNGENKRIATVILNLFDEGELFADILECSWDAEKMDVLGTIRRALIDQKYCNTLLTGISIGTNEDPNTRDNRWRNVLEYSKVEWAQNVRWVKFEYLFDCPLLGTSYKGYRARFVLEGHMQKLSAPHPYHTDRPHSARYW